MGDLLEITSWPKYPKVYYRVTGSAINVEIKAPGYALIGLSTGPRSPCEYWIGLGDQQLSWIRRRDTQLKQTNTPNLLSALEFKKFWITWNAESIKVGRAGEIKPFLSHSNKEPALQYVTFNVLRDYNPVHWRFHLPPLTKQEKKPRPITDGKLNWVQVNEQLPDDALIGGYEQGSLYIVRAHHHGSFTPGKFLAAEGTAYVSWGGEAHPKEEFEVLCGYDCSWVTTCMNRIPVKAVVGGYSEDSQERLFVGRALHNGHLVPGKVQPSHKVCYIPFEGREIAKKKYEVLVEPNIKTHAISEHSSEAIAEAESDDDNQTPVWEDHEQSMDEDEDDDDEGGFIF